MHAGFLHKYYLENGGKRLHKWLHYFSAYERHLMRFCGKSPFILEIGVFGGGSLSMWKAFFGEGSTIIGLDINEQCQQYASAELDIFIGSQDDPAIFEQIFLKYPRIDIVIDDGSHISRHMIKTFDILYDYISPNGVYLVEDTHTNYWPEMEGGVGLAGTFMEFVKAKLDEINATHCRGVIPVTAFTRGTEMIACYDSLVVFERKPQGRRQTFATVPMTEDTSPYVFPPTE